MACSWRRCEAWWGQPLGPLSSITTGLLFHAETLSLGLVLLAQPLRPLGGNAPGLLFLALPLGLLGSNAPGLFCHAEALPFPGSHPQGLFLCALWLGLISCNATGLFCHAETLSLGILLLAQQLRLLGSNDGPLEQPHAITRQPRTSLAGVPQRYPLSLHDRVAV